MSDKIWIAMIGLGGAAIGATASMSVQLLKHCLENRAAARRDGPRKSLLTQMLADPEYSWRKLATLMHVIGADEETTKRLLLEVGARASEDGKALWGLVERNPLPRAR